MGLHSDLADLMSDPVGRIAISRPPPNEYQHICVSLCPLTAFLTQVSMFLINHKLVKIVATVNFCIVGQGQIIQIRHLNKLTAEIK